MVSGMVWGGTPLTAVVKASKEATIVVSPDLLEEYRQTPAALHLECCREAGADVLLTGDKDLLELDPDLIDRQIPGLRIVDPKTFTSL